MIVGEPPSGPRLAGAFRLAVVKSPDLAAPLIGALDAADVGAWVWVEAEGCLYWSPRIPDLLSFTTAGTDDLPSRFVKAVHHDDRSAVLALIAGDWQGDSFQIRFRLLDRNRRYRWLETRGRIERDWQDRLVRQGGTLRDITTDVAQEEARAEAAARLEALVNAMPFAVWGRSGPDLRITHQNAESIAWWGDLLGRAVEDVPPSVARVWRAQVTEAMAGSVVRHRTHYPVENRMRVIDEIIAPVIVDGEATGVVGVGRDVTDEHRQQEFEALLIGVTAEFASRSAATLDAALIAALERIARFLGAPLFSLCELSDDNWLSVTHWWGDADHRPAATEIDCAPIAALADQLKANQPVLVRSIAEFPEDSATRQFLTERQLESFVMVPTRQSDGTLVVLAVASAPGEQIDWPPDTVALLRLAGRLMAGVLARLRAESNQRLVERRMQETQKLESLGVLAGGIAHDFNNLLTSILGYASLLRADHGEVKGISDPLEQIEQASRRAADLCRQMLAYAGKGRFSLQSLNVNDVLRDSQSLLRVSVPRKATLQLSLSPSLPNVLADPAQLRQLLMNLLINAGEALGDSEGRITIATATKVRTARELTRAQFNPDLPDGKYVSLSITDTGEGMTPETLARIFDPFFSTKFTGRGLGLSAVVGIVRAHKGALRVESRPGKGSTFELLLPVQPGPIVPPAATPLYNLATRLDWISSGTVLVVDDEPGIRQLVRNVLQRSGLSVVLADDGRQGVEAFRAIADDVRLVLVDLTMPGLDGRETLAAMRQIRPDVPAILMSGYSPENVGMPSSQAFLQKPFTPAALRAVVRRVLDEVVEST